MMVVDGIVKHSEIIEDVQFQFLMHNGMLMRTQHRPTDRPPLFLCSVLIFHTQYTISGRIHEDDATTTVGKLGRYLEQERQKK